ncbi:MAG: hypothetical protein ABJL99_06020 [Aliishimia sp.]
MDQQRRFSDEELTAFLDGEAATDDVRAIEAALDQDTELAQRLSDLDISFLDLKGQFDGLLAQAPPVPDLPAALPTVANLNSTPRWPSLGLGLSAGLVAGFAMAVTFGLTRPPAPEPTRGWLSVVAGYQMLYTPETLVSAETSHGTPLTVLSDIVGLDLTALAQVEGLTFKRAQRLGFNGKPLIQIAYTLPDGTPFAICILPNGSEARGPRFQELEGMQAADWTTGSHGVLLIGGDDPSALGALADTVETLL